jgi:hypothetical protein
VLKVHGFWFRVLASRFRVQGSGFRVCVYALRNQGLGIEGKGFRVEAAVSCFWPSGYRVQGLGFSA